MPKLLVALLIASGVVHAECYTRSAASVSAASRIERVTDLTQTILPAEGKQVRCRVTFRALIDNAWHTAEGEALGPAGTASAQVCSQALNSGRSSVLVSVAGSKVNMNQEMVCTDEDIPVTRTVVNIGDTVRDSTVAPHPIYRSTFAYRGAVCRWFIESLPEAGQIDMKQGIICRPPNQNGWKVVDKW